MQIKEIYFESIESTNTWAKKNVNELDPSRITCIVADEQTEGRGRFQRTWVSPKDQNIYATFYFQLPKDSKHLISLAQVMTVSCADVLIKEGLCPKIKWPNDVLLSEKKISGVLCETQFNNDHVDVFLGIGINVNMEDFSGIEHPATSLKIETKKTWSCKNLLKSLQDQFVQDLEKFKKEGFSPFHEQFENLLLFKGEKIRCYDGKNTWEGICHSITNEGQLNLYLSSKEMKTLSSGDVSIIKNS